MEDEKYIAKKTIEAEKRIEEMTQKDVSRLLEFHMSEERYSQLVPIEGILERPKKNLKKQIDPKWLREISTSNRPNMNDIVTPNNFLPDYMGLATGGGFGGSGGSRDDVLKDDWNSVKGREQMNARFAAYHM